MERFFSISDNDIIEMLSSTNRFLCHVLIVHIVTCIIEGNTDIVTEKLIKSLLITGVAVMIYYLFIDKYIDSTIKRLKNKLKNNNKNKK